MRLPPKWILLLTGKDRGFFNKVDESRGSRRKNRFRCKTRVTLPRSLSYGVTVTVNAAAWLVAEVAVTVMLEVPAGVPLFWFVTGGPPPPQLTTHNATAMQ